MPQMSPLYWICLYFYFISFMMILVSLIFFMINNLTYVFLKNNFFKVNSWLLW